MSTMVNPVDVQTRNVSTQKDEITFAGQGAQSHKTAKTKGAAEAFAVDFGSHNAQTGAYAEHKRGTGLLAAESEKDLSAAHNMDIILAHTLSPEDYKKAKEEGFDPSEIEAGETTTIVDHIKASLIQAGVEVSGVTDSLSREQLAEITGSEAYAAELIDAFSANDIPLTKDNIDAVQEAWERAQTLAPLSDDSIFYMVENELEPGVENLYLAAHSAKGRTNGGTGFFAEEGGYLSQKSGNGNLDALQGQIDDVIKTAGFKTEDDAVQHTAKGLIEAGVTLTPAHLQAAVQLRDLMLPPERDLVVRASAAAIADGQKSVQGNLADPTGMLQHAAQIDADVRDISEDGIRAAIEKQEAAGEADSSLTLRDMIEATKQTEEQPVQTPAQKQQTQTTSVAGNTEDARFLQARLQLEEVRFHMSVSVNMTLLRKGIAIDTSPMEQLIDNLKQAIAEQADALFGTGHTASYAGSAELSMTTTISTQDAVSRYRLYSETNLKVEYMRTEMPLGTIGALKDQFKTDTLDDIFTGATTWKVANEAYETMQTEVRRDLGDSIKKAFRNAEDLLKDAGVTINEDNLRAVRILGYNRMEVTAKNVADVASWDARLHAVLEDLKPAAVLDLIRDGKNPLQMTLDELAEELSVRAQDTDTASDTQYARFLYKLEHAGQISGAERTSYIGIYRMFETLERTDHAAIGTLLNTGADMSIRNLLTATRSMRTADGRGIDLRAEDDFDGYKITGDTNRIDTQIEAAFRYYSAKADTAFAHLAPEKLAALAEPEDMLLPAFAQQMEELPEDEQADASYDTEQLLRMRETLHEQDAAAAALEAFEMPLTTGNLEAYQMLQNADKSLWERLRTADQNKRTSDIIATESGRLASALDSGEDYADIYKRSTEAMQEAVKEQMAAGGTGYVDYQALSLLHRQLGTVKSMADRGSFEVPVETASGTVSMHVTLREDEGSGSGVRISLDTQEYGTLFARFSVRDGSVSGILSTTFGETPQVKAYMESLRTRMADGIADHLNGLTLDPAQTALTYGVSPQTSVTAGDNVERAGARTLFQIAKVFTEAVAI